MEQANTKKALEFEVGENIEILPIGELTYAGRNKERLEFIKRNGDVIISCFIDEEKLGIDDDSKLRVRFGLSPEHQRVIPKRSR